MIRFSGNVTGNLYLLWRFGTKFDGAVKLIYVVYKAKQRDSASCHRYSYNATGCNLSLIVKNGGRGTKPTYIFMVIIPLLVIELKATPNGNPSDDFYWRQKSNSLNLVQIIPPSRPIIFHLQIYIA